MNEIKKISGIHYFYGFYKEYFIVETIDLKNILFISQKDLEFSHKIQIKDPSLRIRDNHIYIYAKDIFIYDDIKRNFILYRKSQGERFAIFSDKYLYGYNIDYENKILSVSFFDRNSQNKLWQQIYENRIFPRNCHEHLFLTDINYTYIDKINLETGKSEWILDFGMKVHGDILKFGNTIIIPLDNDHLLGINAETGEKLWELEDCFNYQMLDDKTDLLYGYGGERYEIIDAMKGKKVLRKQFEGSRDKYYISVVQHMTVLSEDSL
jgi:hypothetical protein